MDNLHIVSKFKRVNLLIEKILFDIFYYKDSDSLANGHLQTFSGCYFYILQNPLLFSFQFMCLPFNIEILVNTQHIRSLCMLFQITSKTFNSRTSNHK